MVSRLNQLKSQIISTFGKVLNVDSTKKMTKKLAGKLAGTAAWVTNVGKEKGEILQSVLTTSEGIGLKPMAQGLVKRYAAAKEPSPKLIYVDGDLPCK